MHSFMMLSVFGNYSWQIGTMESHFHYVACGLLFYLIVAFRYDIVEAIR